MATNPSYNQTVHKVYVVVVFSDYLQGAEEDVKTRLREIHISTLSNAETINVMKYDLDPSSYIVAFDGGKILSIDPKLLISNLVSVFKSNMPDKMMEFTIGTTATGDEIGYIEDEVKYALMLHNTFITSLTNVEGYNYSTSELITQLFENYKAYINVVEDISSILESMKNDGRASFQSTNDIEPADNSLSSYMRDFITAGDDGKKKKKKKKKKGNTDSHPYGISKVIRTAKSPKKLYRKHGIMIAKKDRIKNDKRIIKEFIKDFIPGDEKWKRHFREELLDRWIHAYAITNKQMKLVKKAQKRESERARNGREIQQTLDMTRKLFNVPIDRWNDPTR